METPPAIPPLPLPTDDAQIQRAIQLLEKGTISEAHGRLRWSSNYTFLVQICDDEFQAAAVYKPRRGERPLWDFPEGTLCLRERAAYVLSEALGWRIVPPTVLRDGTHGLGSIQLFIEHDPEINYFSLDARFAAQLKKIAVFDYITNNADRKGGHILMDSNQKLWGIDHGICFHVVPKLRSVIWDFVGETLEAPTLEAIQTVQQNLQNEQSELSQSVANLLAEPERMALIKRMDALTTLGKFPQPRHGPNYPWPPV